MINRLKLLLNKHKEVSVIKRFLNNPDRFRLIGEVEGSRIIITIEEKEKGNEN